MRITTPYLLILISTFFLPQESWADVCATSQAQKARINDVIDAHKESVSDIVQDIVEKPRPAKEEACLDNLMGVNFNVFTVNPTGIYQGIFDNLLDNLINQACQATTDAWNGAVQGIAQDLQLPYDLGGVTITATSNNWGHQDDASLQLPQSEVDSFNQSVESISNVNNSTVDADTGGFSGQIAPPNWSSNNQQISDDLQGVMSEMFF